MRGLVLACALLLAGLCAGEPTPKLWKPTGKKAHDPWKKFCGSVLCYDLLEVSEDAPEDAIKKSYRKLAREWHPDKNPEKGAREKFQKIAKAYEILSTEGERKKYDHLMKHPEEYRKLYGEYYFKVAAPPSDVTIVVLLLLVIVSAIHFTILQQKKTEYNSKLLKLCVENKGPSSGGSLETLEIYREALEQYEAKNAVKVKAKALKSDAKFISTVEDILKQNDLFLRNPSVWDTFPICASKGLASNFTWFARHSILGQPYSDEEKELMLSSRVEEWSTLSAKQKADLIEHEAWKSENLAEWRKQQTKKSK